MAQVMHNLYASSTYLADLDEALEHSMGVRDFAGATLLIAGAGGLIGSFLVDVLARANETLGLKVTIVASGRDMSRLAARFESCPFPGVELLELDVAQPVDNDVEFDFVIHAASNAHPGAFVADPVGTLMSNVVGLACMADLCLSCGARLLYVSSGEVYGSRAASATPATEDDYGYVNVLAPRSAYPMGKRAAETLMASYAAQQGLDAVAVRPCHTYGPTATAIDTRAGSVFFSDAIAGRDIELSSAGVQVRSYSHVADAASGLLTVLAKGTSGQAYNLANQCSRVSIAEFAEAIAAYAGVEVRYRSASATEKALVSPVPNQVLDSSRLEALGWIGSYTLERGVARTIAAMREAICWRT